jgi:hypothetical protein
MQRTVRIVRELGITDIVLVAPEIDPPGATYEIEGVRLYRKAVADKEKDNYYRQADRYLPRSLWNTEGRTLFLPGDFYFCRATLEGMINYDPDTWVFYARIERTTWPAGNRLATARTRMILGFGFPAHEHDLVIKNIEDITALQRNPNSPIDRSLGLDIYRFMAGQAPEEIARTGGASGKGIWKDHPPHLWQPPAGSADVDFDLPKTYGAFMLHYQPDLHD